MNFPGRQYLGDSVYASDDGIYIWLETDNGNGPTNSIALDDDVFDALLRYQKYVANWWEEENKKSLETQSYE